MSDPWEDRAFLDSIASKRDLKLLQTVKPVNGYYNNSYAFWVVCALAPNFLESINRICSFV